MKKSSRLFLMLGLTLGLTRSAFATCTGGGDPCNQPRNGSITAHTATTLTESVQNSATPNVAFSIYFFQATILGSPQDTGTADSKTVIALTEDFTSPSTPNDIIVDTVKPLLASTAYHGYSKACPPGSSLPTNAGCSAWVLIGNQTTDALTNAGFANIAAGDTKPTQFTARTNNSVVDQIDVAAWLTTLLASTEVGNCSLTKNLQPFPASGTASLTIANADCSTLVPNRPYTLTENLEYTPTQAAPPYTTTKFYTQAADPAAGTVSAVTHCAAHITYSNASGSFGNPSDTSYTVAVGGGVAAQSKPIGGSGSPGDTGFQDFTDLQPGVTYTPTVQAQNRGGNPWLPSNAIGYVPPTFTTKGTTGSFTPQNITTTSADIAYSIDLTGVTDYQLILNGANFGTKVSGQPANPIHLTGLTPNTVYKFQIQFFEGTNCTFTVPTTAAAFTTTAADPTAFVFTAADAFTLNASWTDTLNPPATKYMVNYCTNSDMVTGCQTVTTAAGTKNATLAAQPTTQYWAQVKALTVGGGLDSNYIPVPPATITTPLNKTGITISPASVTLNAGVLQLFSASVIDQNGSPVSNPAVTWSFLGPGGGTLSGPNPAPTINYTATTPGGPYILQGSVVVHSIIFTNVSTITVVGTGPFFSSGPVVSVNPDNKSGSASALATDNANGHTAISYNWALVSGPAGGAITVTPNNSQTANNAALTFNKAGTYTISCTASDNFGATTVSAPPVTVNPILSAITVTPNNVTLKVLQDQMFTANGFDQFGGGMTLTGVTWSTTGGNISQAGEFNSQTLGTGIRVTATKGNLSGSAIVNLVNFDVSAASAYPVPYKANFGNGGVIHFVGLGSQSTLHIYTTSGRRVFDISLTADHYDWQIKNSSGESIASGVYFYVIESPEGKKNGKLIIIQ